MNSNNIVTAVEPGSRKLIELHVGALPSGTSIRIRAHVIRSINPGPTVLLLGGVHGDEINGIEIVRRAVTSEVLGGLQAGAVVAIPLLNVFGFLNYSRAVPDGKDVNRSFPGTPRGSLASRVAHVLTKQVLPAVDFAMDFHTGGNSVYNHPQTRHAPSSLGSQELAEAFAAPLRIASPLIQRSLRRTAQRLNVPILIYEGGENLRLNPYCVEEALAGIRRVLTSKGMLDAAATQQVLAENKQLNQVPTIEIRRRRWLRARRAGLFECVVPSGNYVVRGQLLGYLRDPYGEWAEAVTCPSDGYLIGHDNSPVASQGDALFHLGFPGAAEETILATTLA